MRFQQKGRTLALSALGTVVIAPLLLLLACGSQTPITLSINPPTSAVLVNQTVQFTATVKGTHNTAVTWSVAEPNGGTVTGGLYKAPWANGTYHVVAKSVADANQLAYATISISAPFAFIETLPDGTSQPFSATPMFGTLGADRKFVATNINDPATGKPMDLDMSEVSLSSDGKKMVFSLLEMDSAGYYNPKNLYTANTDGTGFTQLTYNAPGDGVYDMQAQFSPDGRQIIYLTSGNAIYVMNSDGTNPLPVYAPPSGGWVFRPTFSPDGTKIAANGEWFDGYSNGIIIMNADGTNTAWLSSSVRPLCNGFAWDAIPSFTNDGKQIAFSSICWPNTGGTAETIYIMNLDGSNVTALHGDSATFISSQPRPVGNQIVFYSNVDYPGTDQFEMYSIMPDGSGLTRLTDNTLYDGFSTEWMGYSASASAAANQLLLPARHRLEHLRRLQEYRRTH